MYLPKLARHAASILALFSPWDDSQWVASDDTVRGGKSHSSLEIIQPGTPSNPFKQPIARFHGTLDYATLGGSGFASQRTVDDWAGLDLTEYDSIILDIAYADEKTYTFNIKDTVLPPLENGAEQATISWAYDFQVPATQEKESISRVTIKFQDLVPTYRGRVLNDTEPLDLANIVRINIMIRSFFAEQDGAFELGIKSITARNQSHKSPKFKSLL
ncbi:hypothetical protein F66182_3441 [Fusarium sp. NRRL 66182]|nr:hypothetical protein F66182_3441 [Fusarium sp. NRRL 66182]